MGTDLIRIATPVIGEREHAFVQNVLREGWLSSQGPFVKKFEEAFAEYCGVRFGIAVSSGTTAIHLTLAALGIGPGDEVILPAATHIACANMVTLTGARPVLVDILPDTWGMDPDRLEEKITPRTKAIMVVHLYGHPVDMEPILRTAERHRLTVIEDAAEAHGAEVRGRRTGALGYAGCFSFYANKIITTGEGGMITTNNEDLANRCRKMRNHCYEKERRFWHRELGYNYAMTNLQAGVGLAQMEQIDTFVATHRRNARLYNDLLGGLEGLRLPVEKPWAKNVYWMYTVIVEEGRDDLARYLDSRQIETRPFFFPIHLQPLYEAQFHGQHYPVVEELARKGLNLPSGNDLEEKGVRRVAEAVRTFFEKRGTL